MIEAWKKARIELHSCKKFIAKKKFLSKVNDCTCRSCMEIRTNFVNEE